MYIRGAKPKKDLDPNHDDLVGKMVAEMNAGDKGTGPKIIEEDVSRSDRLHVYVIWDDWDGVSEEHRSAAILEAYRKKHGLETMLRVSIAMGLTQEEDNEMGISKTYE